MIDAGQRRAREAVGLPDDRVQHVTKRTVPDDKFAVVVRECQACGCNNARPCGTRRWTCDFCGAEIPGVLPHVDWRRGDRYQP